jgi:hypothetical protein
MMHMPRLVRDILVLFFLITAVGAAYGQSKCISGVSSVSSCPVNPNPAPIPSGLGGIALTPDLCSDAIIYALASLYSYNDPGCHRLNTDIVNTSHTLRLLEELNNIFTAPVLMRLSIENNFHGTLYCDAASSTPSVGI